MFSLMWWQTRKGRPFIQKFLPSAHRKYILATSFCAIEPLLSLFLLNSQVESKQVVLPQQGLEEWRGVNTCQVLSTNYS